MNIKDIDLADLRAKADAAMPGIWECKRFGTVEGGPLQQYENGSGRPQIASFIPTAAENDGAEYQETNANFVCAARPEVVTALLDEIEALRAEVAKLMPAKPAAASEHLPSHPSFTLPRIPAGRLVSLRVYWGDLGRVNGNLRIWVFHNLLCSIVCLICELV